MEFCLIPNVPPLTPPETGGERTKQDIPISKIFNRSNIYRPPLQKGDKRGILLA